MNILEYLFRWVLLAASSSLFFVTGISISLAGFNVDFRRRWLRLWARSVLYSTGFPLVVRGDSRLPERCVIIANHQSLLDVPIYFSVFERGVTHTAGQKWMRNPLVRWIPYTGDYIMVAPAGTEQDSQVLPVWSVIKQAEEWLDRGYPVFFSPEGTRSADCSLQAFGKGGFYLAIRKKVPLIVVTLLNAGEVLPKGSLWPHPAPLEVVIDEAIDTANYDPNQTGQLMQRVRELMQGHLDRHARRQSS